MCKVVVAVVQEVVIGLLFRVVAVVVLQEVVGGVLFRLRLAVAQEVVVSVLFRARSRLPPIGGFPIGGRNSAGARDDDVVGKIGGVGIVGKCVDVVVVSCVKDHGFGLIQFGSGGDRGVIVVLVHEGCAACKATKM